MESHFIVYIFIGCVGLGGHLTWPKLTRRNILFGVIIINIMTCFATKVVPNLSSTRSVFPKGSGHIGQRPIVWGMHRPREHRPKDASSKGRIVQGTHRQGPHCPRDASSRGSIVQGTHRPGDASSRGRIVQGTHRPRDASSRSWSFRDTSVADEIALHCIFILVPAASRSFWVWACAVRRISRETRTVYIIMSRGCADRWSL